jgi:DNA repair protein RadC
MPEFGADGVAKRERTRLIADLPEEERPRERLLKHGPSALTNAELLAILLNTGMPGESVMDVAERLLRDYGGFAGLMTLSAGDLARLHGLGPAKATKLKASMEIASRILAMNPNQRPRISSPDDITNLIGLEMSLLEQEQLRVVLLNTRNEVIGIRTLYNGTTNQAHFRVAEVFKDAVRANAVAIVVAHNHP